MILGAGAGSGKGASTTASAASESAQPRTEAEQSADGPAPSGAIAESERPVESSPAAGPPPLSESAVPEPSNRSDAPVSESVSTPSASEGGASRTAGYWLLSLFAPAPADSIDWGRGNYAVIARGGRVESAAGSGLLKKQVRMVAEGSVLYASGIPRGAAPDVAPDGFAHPVFRAGFALAIPLPEAG